ncbi:MAG TPA: bifunctional hydroxymethylpyrimidine kinase/phosphomethylpyrimidine kinase [Fodinibius sp.]|nr:bifunctional hydroxymethylpyrimidine kinase/phosphomethylpyrimidine kinase [Fodinibius sp.]
MNNTVQTVLTIAGSDPSGGAGIQADIKTFSAFEVYGMSVLTALTIGNTLGVTQIEMMTPDFVAGQIQAVREDISSAAVKTGLLGNATIIERVAMELENWRIPLVVDPVIATKRGDVLLSEEGIEAYRSHLIPHADIITPNIAEAEQLAQITISSYRAMPKAAEKLLSLGCHSVVVKGGHFDDWQHSNDLYYDGNELIWMKSKRLNTRHTHGAGDAFSAAIAACMARGMNRKPAAEAAKTYISRGIEQAPGLGRGEGPIAF